MGGENQHQNLSKAAQPELRSGCCSIGPSVKARVNTSQTRVGFSDSPNGFQDALFLGMPPVKNVLRRTHSKKSHAVQMHRSAGRKSLSSGERSSWQSWKGLSVWTPSWQKGAGNLLGNHTTLLTELSKCPTHCWSLKKVDRIAQTLSNSTLKKKKIK